MGATLGRRVTLLLLMLVWCDTFVVGAAVAETSVYEQSTETGGSLPSEGQPSFFSKVFNHLDTEFILSTGIRRDSLDWSIAGNNTNVLSELTWTNVDSYQLSLANRSRYKRHIVFRGHFNYSFIHDGRVQDSDYGRDDRNDEYSRSISDTIDDDMWDLSIGGGYAFYFLEDRLTLAPMIGFSYNKQNLRLENGNQLISLDNPYSPNPSDDPPPVGPLSDQLNSTYFARWMGPWIGIDLRYRLDNWPYTHCPTEFGISFELHWADYYGEGNWNLRDDLEHPKSFEHDATGYGLRLAIDAAIALSDRWAATIMLEFQDWKTDSGTDRVFTVENGTQTTRLNRVDWTANTVSLGAVYRF